MNTESVKVLGQDYLFDNVGDALLKIICYGASWFGGVLVSKVQGTLTTNQGVFFLFFASLFIEFVVPTIQQKEKKYFTWWSIVFIVILTGSIIVSFGAMYPALAKYFTPWLFGLSCIAMLFLIIDLLHHLYSLAKNSKVNYSVQTPLQYEQSAKSSYERNGSEGFLTGGNKNE